MVKNVSARTTPGRKLGWSPAGTRCELRGHEGSSVERDEMIDFSRAAIQGFWLGEECVCRIAQVTTVVAREFGLPSPLPTYMTITEEDKVVKSDY